MINNNGLQLPDWYREYSFGDSKIISVEELVLSPDYKSQQFAKNCLVLHLNTKQCPYKEIKELRFYDYRFLTSDIKPKDLADSWWIIDSLNVSGEAYQWDITLQKISPDIYNYSISTIFKRLEVIGKQIS